MNIAVRAYSKRTYDPSHKYGCMKSNIEYKLFPTRNYVNSVDSHPENAQEISTGWESMGFP